MNASLRGWRDYYCDSDDQWNDCERYRLFSNGDPVPPAMLPNGKVPIALAWALNPAPGPDATGSMPVAQAQPAAPEPPPAWPFAAPEGQRGAPQAGGGYRESGYGAGGYPAAGPPSESIEIVQFRGRRSSGSWWSRMFGRRRPRR